MIVVTHLRDFIIKINVSLFNPINDKHYHNNELIIGCHLVAQQTMLIIKLKMKTDIKVTCCFSWQGYQHCEFFFLLANIDLILSLLHKLKHVLKY